MHRSVCTFPTAVACETWTCDGTWTEARSGTDREQERNDVLTWSESNMNLVRDEGKNVVVVSTAGLEDGWEVEDEVEDKRRGSDKVTTREGIMGDERRSIPGGFLVSSESSSASSLKYVLGGRERRGKEVSGAAGMRMLVIVVVLLWAHLVVAV
jgi:hypothetical protein